MAESRSIEIIVNGKKANASVKEMEASVAVLYNQWKKMERGTEEYAAKTAELKEAKSRLGEVREELKNTDEATQSLTESFLQMIPFGGHLQKVSGGMNTVSTSAKALRGAMLAIPILAIIAAITTLLKFFFDTQEGMDKLSAVTRPLVAIWERLKGLLQELGGKLFKQVGEAVKNPRQAFQDFVDFLKDQVINRINSLGVAFSALQKLMAGEFKEGFKQLGDATIQFYAGIENGTDKINKAIGATKSFVEESIQVGQRLDQLQKQIERTEINLINNRDRMLAQIKQLNDVAEDETASLEDRKRSAEEAIEIQRQVMAMDKELIDLRIEKMELEQTMNDTSREDEKELAELKAESFRKEMEIQEAMTTMRNKANIINKGIAAEEKKRLDERKKALEAEQKQEEQRIKDLEAAQKKYVQTIKAAETEVQKLKIAAMEEGLEKELAQLDFEHQQKIAKIEEQRKEIIENALLTEEEKDAALALYEEEKAALEAEKKEEEEELRLEEREAELERIIADLTEEDDLKKALLEQQFLATMDAEYEREQALLNLNKEFLQKKLDALKAAGKGQTTQAIQLQNEIARINKQMADNAIAEQQREQEAKDAIRAMGLSALQDTTRAVIELAGEETKAKKTAVTALKVLQVGEVIINGVKEVQGYWSAYSSIPIAGPIIAALLTAGAVARTAISVSKIKSQQYAEGGFTGPGISVDGSGKLVDSSGYAIAGVVHQDEWVAPAWQVKHPKYANVIGYLEAARRTRGYQQGGMVDAALPTASSASAAAALTDAADVQGQTGENMAETNQKLDTMIGLLMQIADELPVAVPVIDIEEKLSTLNQIRDRATIR